MTASRDRCIDAFGHEWRIIGTPRSEMTFRECRKCYLKEPRGEGLFHEQASRERFELGLFYTDPAGFQHRTYFNSTQLEGPELAQSEAMAEEQNAKVLRIMHEVRRPQTAWEVWSRGCDGKRDDWWLIGSVRRAMTTLADPKCGALINLGTKRRSGPRDKLCYEWALPEQVLSSSEQLTDGSEKAQSDTCANPDG